jgi:hypothetical protein
VRYRRPYQIRHTFGSSELSAGEPPLKVAVLMGHKDWTMLQRHYARWIPEVDMLKGQGSGAVFRQAWRVLSELVETNQLDPMQAAAQELQEEAANVIEHDGDDVEPACR